MALLLMPVEETAERRKVRRSHPRNGFFIFSKLGKKIKFERPRRKSDAAVCDSQLSMRTRIDEGRRTSAETEPPRVDCSTNEKATNGSYLRTKISEESGEQVWYSR